MNPRDRNLRDQETDSPMGYKEATRRLTIRERLESRKADIEHRIKYETAQLAEVETNLKLLNKNKELESLANLLLL